MWDIKDNGNGTYNYNGRLYNNLNSAEMDRQLDMDREDEYWRNLNKPKETQNQQQPGCLSTLIGLGCVGFGIAFGLDGIILAIILVVVGVIVFSVSKTKKEKNRAIVNSAWNDYNQNRPTEAFVKVKDLGDDCPEAASLLSLMYYLGQGVDADMEKALHYAELGKKVDPDTQALYGTILYHKNSSEKERNLGIQELILSITRGSNLGRLRFGEIEVLEGISSESTVEKLKIAGENNYNYAYYLLAQIYLEGIGQVPKNEERGYEYMKKAAELNIEDAIAFFNSQTES